MSKLVLILKFFLKVKFTFKTPQKHEVVVFDDDSFVELKNSFNKIKKNTFYDYGLWSFEGNIYLMIFIINGDIKCRHIK